MKHGAPGACPVAHWRGYNPKRSDYPMPTTPRAPKKNRAAQALGRIGGARNTPAQQAARKANARFAGRPRRVCTVCGERAKEGGHLSAALDATCPGRTWRLQQGSRP